MIISDFAYGEINFDGYQAQASWQPTVPRTLGVEFTTMSKSYNMAGWRVGFCARQCSEMVEAAPGHTIKGYYDYGIFRSIANRQRDCHAR